MLLTLLIVGWAIAVAEWVLLRHPTKLPPLFERGHRGYEVNDPETRLALIGLLALGGLKPAMRFEIGPTDQTLMSDGYTVVNLHDHSNPDPTASFSGTFVSLVNDDPDGAAEQAMAILRRIDNTTTLARLPIPGKGAIIPIYSPRLGMTVTFRRHAMKLGKPPGQKPT
jgi:hypothetical protein